MLRTQQKADEIECAVCCERFAARAGPLSCAHGATTCDACHRKALQSASALVGGVRCMAPSCEARYDEAAIVALLGAMAGKQLVARVSEATFLAQRGAMLCTRPDCGGRILVPTRDDDDEARGSGAGRAVVCAQCAAVICADCHLEGHDGETCEAYAARRSSSDLVVTSEQFINLVTKRCPGCTLRVWKNGGCPHMTCSHCATQFCFGCLKPRTAYAGAGHDACNAVASAFERDAQRRVQEWKNAARTAARRARLAARVQRQARVRGVRVFEESVVRADFFELEFAAATVETTATVEATSVSVATTTTAVEAPPTAKVSLVASFAGHCGVFARAPLSVVPRRTLAMSF